MSTTDPIERFDPETMGGRLLEAEHVARYRWATALVAGNRVLDAGCGTGYGSDLLAEAATEVVGVDVDPGAFADRKPRRSNVSLTVADLRALPDELGRFDAVVCFEVLEHLDDPDPALDGLVRVLAPGGILVVSSPNRDVYPPGNPYHKHEFLPDELAGALSARLANVRLVRQVDWLATGLFGDDELKRSEALEVPVAKAAPGEPGKELYSVALASDEPLPETQPFVMVADTADLKWWQEVVQGLRDELDAKATHVQQLEGWLEQRTSELADRNAEAQELNDTIAAMQATRAWRLGTSYWGLRDRLLRRR
ncbi:MAG TPA: class I SAM-dependent methyltransferase [Gaiellaceae bacterium]